MKPKNPKKVGGSKLPPKKSPKRGSSAWWALQCAEPPQIKC